MVICKVCKHRSNLKFRKKGFEIFECPKCKLIFVNPEQIGKDYLNQYEQDISSPSIYYRYTEVYDKRSFRERLNYFKKIFPVNGSLFEIGSNTGTFLLVAKKLGWKVTGLEPNKKICVEISRKFQDIKIFNRFFDEGFIRQHKKNIT